MIGIAALLIVVLWGVISYKFSSLSFNGVKYSKHKFLLKFIVFIAFFILPLADEILGGIQFRYICGKNSTVFINEEKAKNKELMSGYTKNYFNEYILPIEETVFYYKDIPTGEVVVQWKWFKSSGGWLSRSINFNSSDAPFTFKGDCQPEYKSGKIDKQLNIKLKYQSN